MNKCTEYYMQSFNVDQNTLDKLIATAMAKGGNYADLYFEYSSYSELTLMDEKVRRGGFHEDYGVGIRVLKGEKTGYAYSESTRLADMMAAAKAAAIIGAADTYGKETQAICAAPAKKADTDFYPAEESWRDCGNDRMIPVLVEIDKKIRERDKRAEKVSVRLSASHSDVMMYNSLGELTCDSRPMYTLAAQVVFIEKDGRNWCGTVSRSFRKGPETICGENLSISQAIIDEIVDKAVKNVDDAFEAKRPEGGQMPVVMAAGASGILLHEAMGHAFEADFIRKATSIFTDKLGEQICPKGINIVDDGTIWGNRGACNYDDEGVPGQKTYMVRDGKLESFLHDRISAAHFGVSPTGNGRREDFRINPVPRMRATYMENGDCDPEDIIKSVDKGVYVSEFSNGQVKIGEGDFTFFVKQGWLIEGGKLTMPVKDINIIGNGPRALSQIAMTGNDALIDNSSWTCGKGQSASVSCGMPSILVNGLTVGGE